MSITELTTKTTTAESRIGSHSIKNPCMKPPPSKLAFVEQRYRVIHGARGQRHVSNTGILIRRRCHARAVSHEYIRHIPHLVVGIQHRRLRIASHARGTGFVDHEAGWVVVLERPDGRRP